MAYCDQDTYTDKFFFMNGISEDDDIDSYYDSFERLSIIYISRNKGKMIFKDNAFIENIGTFGGAISINSPNWQNGNKPFIIIYNNVFTQNMAYLSGNAIYIRSTMNEENDNFICGGAHIQYNTFKKNIGMKVHNGGAISAVCGFLTNTKHVDYQSTSAYSMAMLNLDNYLDVKIDITDSVDFQKFDVYAFKFNIQDCTFVQNFAGLKGSAIYIREMSKPKISNCNFTDNGPVLSYFESLYSPYVRYLSSRAITYYDEKSICVNEFDFLANCQSVGSLIDWSHVQGAVYIGHCQVNACMNEWTIMHFELEDSIFSGNQVGYIMDESFPNTLASALFISGGFNNTIRNVNFTDNKGEYELLVKLNGQKLVQYFPKNYFIYQSASLVQVYHNPIIENTEETMYHLYTIFENCYFLRNKHFQSLGLTDSQIYQGSLISQITTYGIETTKFTPILQISNCVFKDNYFIGPSASLIQLYNTLLLLQNSKFENNGILKTTQLTNPDKIKTNIGNLNFGEYNIQESQEYGLIYIEGNTAIGKINQHNITNNTFTYSFAESGSVFYFKIDKQNANIYKNQYLYNFAGTSGSIFYGVSTENAGSAISFSNEQISFQFTKMGTLFIEDQQILNVYNSIFKNIFGVYGSIIYLKKALPSRLQNCSFSLNSKTSTLKTSIQNNFNKNSYDLNTFIDNNQLSDFQNNFKSEAGQIYVTDNVSLLVKDCLYKNLYSKIGSVFYANLNSSVTFINNPKTQNVGIFNCSQGKYGVIALESGSKFYGENLLIKNSFSESSGGAIYLTFYSNSTFKNVSFINNTATTNGLIYISGDSYLNCDECLFLENAAYLDSSVIFADNNPEGLMNIKNSKFINNTSRSNMFNLIYTNAIIYNSTFFDNVSKLVNHGMTLINSKVNLTNVVIDYTMDSFFNAKVSVDTGFFNLNYQSALLIQSSNISNCIGGLAGVLYATGSSSVAVASNTRITNCKADSIGSIFYYSMADIVRISNTFFSNNSPTDVMADRTTVNLTRNIFEVGDSSFVIASSSSLHMYSNQFLNGLNQDIHGKGVYCNCDLLIMFNNTFKNLSAATGGALYLTSSSTRSNFNITQNKFIHNNAQLGGAIYISDAINISLTHNLFVENQAEVITPSTPTSSKLTNKGMGGAIYFDCVKPSLDIFHNCQVNITNNNTFESNSAEHDGGAIIWVSNMFNEDNSNIFINNQAFYGSDVASYAKSLQLEFINNNDYYNPVNNSHSRLLTKKFSLLRNSNRNLDEYFPPLVSGIAFEFQISILDQQDTLYTTDSQSVALLKYDGLANILLKNYEVLAHQGIFSFSNVQIFAEPNTSVSLSLVIQGLNTFSNQLDFLNNPISLVLSFRQCVSGEQRASDNSCVLCPEGSYLYDVPTKAGFLCKPCNESAVCYGGNVVAPKAGYWRANKTSNSWVSCPKPSSCLAGNETEPIGVCAEGYQGIICGDCKNGFSKIGTFECGRCPPKTRNVFQVILIGLFAVLVVLFLVRSTIMSVDKIKPVYSVYLKIMTNHFQIIGAISNINYDWPAQIQSFFNSQMKAAAVSDQVFSFDCFLMGDPNEKPVVSIYFKKLIFYGILPLILAATNFLFWILYLTIKKKDPILKSKYQGMSDKFISSMCVLLFLVHPNISKAMFSSFNCIQID